MTFTESTSERAAHYWFGKWIDDPSLQDQLDHHLSVQLSRTLAQSFPFESLLSACQKLSQDLLNQGQSYTQLLAAMTEWMDEESAKAILLQLHMLLGQDYLLTKLRSELGTARPNVLERRYPEREYEMWTPIGCMVHVMPSNVFAVAALGLIEGLLANNINIVKLSARDTIFAALFAQELIRYDVSDQLQNYIAILRLSSKQEDVLKALFTHADAVSAWGGEKAIAAIRSMLPSHVRVITWGHKVSFGYMAKELINDSQVIEAFALDVCRLDQQACSSPQTIFVEADDEQIVQVAQQLAEALKRVSPTVPAESADTDAAAEITTVLSVAKAEQALGLCHVIESEQDDWRIIVDFRTSLKPSPLYRTICLVPIQRETITSVLRPMRAWLQTCGLAAGFPDAAAISRQLLAAGVSRITRPGQMVESYNGAPHDGVYALQQMMRRVSVDMDGDFSQIGSFAQLAPPVMTVDSQSTPIMDKTDFQQLTDQNQDPHTGLIVRSGGSSGKTAYSQFRWADYALQMKETSHGLVAAGLDPKHDVVMNLFASGYMYGSFISFWTILEHLQVRQLPMAMVTEYELIVDEIINHQVTTLIGMTPHLLGLFINQGERLKSYGGIKKIFYGGEGLSAAQFDFLHHEHGIAVVQSAAYGSNDAGPMGYQCEHSKGGVHHLISSLQHLEILHPEKDEPVVGDEVGRLILTSRARTSPVISRYEIGDMGRWVAGECACGRKDPRFELMGRLGDLFKAGTPLLNYAVFVRMLSQQFNYAGLLQIHIDSEGAFTIVTIWVDPSLETHVDQVKDYLYTHYTEIRKTHELNLAFKLRVEQHPLNEFVRVQASGKVKHLCDHRTEA